MAITLAQLAGVTPGQPANLGTYCGLLAAIAGWPKDGQISKADTVLPPGVVGIILLHRALCLRELLPAATVASALQVLKEPILEHAETVINALDASNGLQISVAPRLLVIADRRYIGLQGTSIQFDLLSWQQLESLPQTREGVSYDITQLIIDEWLKL